MTNHESAPRSCEIALRSVDGVDLDPTQLELRIDAGAKVVTEVRARFPDSVATHSLPLLADVTWDGERLGEVAEAVAYW